MILKKKKKNAKSRVRRVLRKAGMGDATEIIRLGEERQSGIGPTKL